MGWYREWFGTPWYGLLYGHRDELEAKTWVDTILRRWQLPAGSQVLDIACGRGRHAFWFARAGMKVTGIDISEESIAEARQNVPEADFHVHDMRRSFGSGSFHGICCLFTSLGYFESMADDRKVFAAAIDGLRPGGRFVIDFMNANVVLPGLVPEENITREGVHFHITRSVEEGVIVKRIRVEDGHQVHDFIEKVQVLMPDELERMATEAGFQIEDRTDGPDPSPFDPFLSTRFVLWMKKPGT